MFEKEAEEYLKKDGTKAEQILDMLNKISPLKITLKQLPFILAMIQQTFKDGAEFGYNKAKEELEEENAELKEQCSILADCNTCHSSCKNENAEMKKQLTKAKEIIKKLYSHVFQGMGFMEINDYNVQKAEAEQFLNSEFEELYSTKY